jgi:O-acetyl-ADP-ribose deacetylase
VYGYPVPDAARVALTTVKDYLSAHPEIELVRFVLFGQPTFAAFAEVLQELV